jgi:hypothetical protein
LILIPKKAAIPFTAESSRVPEVAEAPEGVEVTGVEQVEFE